MRRDERLIPKKYEKNQEVDVTVERVSLSD
jgi:hypothetical protein